MVRKQTTIYLDRGKYDRLKELVAPRPISREIDDLIEQKLIEIEGEGGEYEPTKVDYEELEKEHGKKHKEITHIESLLKVEYDEVRRVTRRCKFNEETLELTPEIVKCILDTYEGNPANAHIYINLIELTKKRREIEEQLMEIRLQGSKTHTPTEA